MTSYLHDLLKADGRTIEVESSSEMAEIKKIKEKECKVAQDYEADLKQAQEQSGAMTRYYKLPGGGDL